jgi:regulatory protein
MPQTPQGEDDSARKAPRALARALRLLLQKSRSKANLRRILAEEGLAAADIDGALAEVQAHGYVHDGRLAESIGHAAHRRGKGPAWLEQALRQRQVDPDSAKEALGDARAREGEDATRTLLARASRLPPAADPRARARALRFLLGRGFSPTAAQQAVRAWLRQQGDDG